jgi:predicted deoxyguanosinetriphosphate triphosphohydrolase
MCIYSKFWLHWEKINLAPYAVQSDHPWYTRRSSNDNTEEAFDSHGSRSRYRTAFEIDKDRITNSQAFRRLEYKTQVFVTHEGDNYRTRLTHSLEVAEIARHIARALRLNEHLVESIALGHDLGHAPYGHEAERAINEWIRDLEPGLMGDYYFSHNRHSVENVEHLEPGYDWDNRDPKDAQQGFSQGLNLTKGVREGILVHTTSGYRGMIHQYANFKDDFELPIRKLAESNKKKGLYFPGSLEAQVVRIADDLAQKMHDLEDGFRSNMLKKRHVKEVMDSFFKGLENRVLDEKTLAQGRYLEHKELKTCISKGFLHDIVCMLDSDLLREDPFGERNYGAMTSEELQQINDRLSDDKEYREKFKKAAQVSFLLHMWRKDDYFDRLEKGEQSSMRTRILKYVKLLFNILQDGGDPNYYPSTYNMIAFLRGILLANVIEHSFWNIHKLMDPDFGNLEEKEILEQVSKRSAPGMEGSDHYLMFVLVDGITKPDDQRRLSFKKVKGKESRYCYCFSSEEERHQFIGTYYNRIMSSNGFFLESQEIQSFRNKRVQVRKVRWLNKSPRPEATQYIQLELDGDNEDSQQWVPLERVNVFFTGYQELCPGIKDGRCDYAPRGDCHGNLTCQFRSDKIRYPDINRLIDFQDEGHNLYISLKKLISRRIHQGSRIARMNYMGEKIIHELLSIYLKNPRIMHDRVWARLQSYPGMKGVSVLVKDWIKRPIYEKEKRILPQYILERLMDENDPHYDCNRYSLIRLIINHIAGMTDRFVSNEFNRIHQSGREVEIQDEIYFFS